MFDIGFGEIFLIAVVALLVLGPERLPKAARFTGLWVRRARAQWYSVKAELENELADEDLRRGLKQTRDELAEARDSLAQGGAALQQQFEETRAEVHETLRSDADREADADIERPLSSVSDALEQPELPLGEDEPPREDAHDRTAPAPDPSARSAHDARR